MEINRKTYSGIIKLLRGKKLSADDALEVVDDICTLLEKTPTIDRGPIANVTNQDGTLRPEYNKTPEEENTGPRIYKPYEKVNGGQVDKNGKFHPIAGGIGRGGIRNEGGKIVDTT